GGREGGGGGGGRGAAGGDRGVTSGSPAGAARGHGDSPLPGRGLDEFFRIVGDGVVVVFVLPDGAPPGSWLHIGPDCMVTAYTGKVEMGQNIRTSLAQAVAEELRVPLSTVRLVMGDTDHTPFDLGT